MTPVPLIEPADASRVFANWVDCFDLTVDWSIWRFKLSGQNPLSFEFQESGPPDQVIYFAAGDDGPVKIGWSRSPLRRIAALSTRDRIVRPIAFVACQSRDSEWALHSALWRFCVRKPGVRRFRPPEWYHRESPVYSLALRLANASVASFAERYQDPFVRRKGMKVAA